MAKPMGIALHSFISGTPRAPWVPMEAPSSPSPHLPLHVGVSGRLHPGAGWPETGFQVAARVPDGQKPRILRVSGHPAPGNPDFQAESWLKQSALFYMF